MPAWVAPAIAGVASIASSVLGGSKRSSMDKVLQGFNVHQAQFDESVRGERYSREVAGYDMARQLYEERNNQIELAARDARAAGLHPLFALGGSMNSSPSFNFDVGSDGYAPGGFDGQAATGSLLGDVATGIGAAARAWMEQKEQARADARAADQGVVDRAQADYYAAMAAKTKQEMLNVRTYGLGDDTGPTPAIKDWPVKVMPQQAHRDRVKVKGQDGREYSVPNPEVFEEFFSPSTLGAIYEYINRAIGEVQYWGGFPTPQKNRW